MTARLAGFATIAAFFFLSSEVSLNLFHSAKYSLLGDVEQQKGNTELAITYYGQADLRSFNTHYANYQLGTIYMETGKLALAREHFEKAKSRFPSAQAFLNASNLQSDRDISLATAYLMEGLNYFPDQPELKNNLGIVYLKNGQGEKALDQFAQTESNQAWNQAPLANQWSAIANIRKLSDVSPDEDYARGNLVVKTNVLSALLATGTSAKVDFDSSYVNSPFTLQRQAYLLNASYVFADTILQNLITQELADPVPGLQHQLRRALARNLYTSGKVKSAFQVLDYIQQGVSGIRAGEVLNEMGMLAMDQHAPAEALDLFDKAIGNGFKQAEFNKLFALLEDGQYPNAAKLLEELVAKDSMYVSLKSSLANVFKPGTDTTTEANYNEIYYRGIDMNPTEFINKLDEFSDISQRMVLERIANEMENRGLSATHFAGIPLPKVDFSGIDQKQLIATAKERPFDEKLILKACEVLMKIEPNEAYNLLVESLEYNPYSIPLLKSHAMTSIEISLPEYGRPSIDKLSRLLSKVEFAQFEIGWYKRKEEKKSDWNY